MTTHPFPPPARDRRHRRRRRARLGRHRAGRPLGRALRRPPRRLEAKFRDIEEKRGYEAAVEWWDVALARLLRALRDLRWRSPTSTRPSSRRSSATSPPRSAPRSTRRSALIGDELGLYRAMADGQPVSSEELAARTGTQERYVREWLAAQAASGFVEYGEAGYVLPPEHALVLADEASPFDMTGVLHSANAAVLARERVAERFVTGEGLGWHEHHHGLFARRRAGVRGRLPRAPRGGVAAGARRRRRAARGRRLGRRRRLRPRRVDDPDGAGLPGRALRRDRLPRRVDRGRARARRRGGRRRPGDVRGRGRGRDPGLGLRPRRVLRRVPRPRRPARGGPQRGLRARAGRPLHARRAARGRPGGGQPAPDRPLLLRRCRRSCARPARSRSPAAPGSAPRRARRACARCSRPAASARSAAPRRRR